MSRREIPFAHIDRAIWVMEQPLRHRQISLFDWMLPPDDSLEVYRQNLVALGRSPRDKQRATNAARHEARFGHPLDRGSDRHCRTCDTIRKAAAHRLKVGIPLDAPKMTPKQRAARRSRREAA